MAIIDLQLVGQDPILANYSTPRPGGEVKDLNPFWDGSPQTQFTHGLGVLAAQLLLLLRDDTTRVWRGVTPAQQLLSQAVFDNFLGPQAAEQQLMDVVSQLLKENFPNVSLDRARSRYVESLRGSTLYLSLFDRSSREIFALSLPM